MTNTSLLLQVQDLHTSLLLEDKRLRVVDGIDLEIHRGETLAILGESGCGKSMTALSLMRLLPTPVGQITQGKISLGGLDILSLSESDMRRLRGARIAMIFQEPMTSLNPVQTIGQQIAESVRIHSDLSGQAVRERVQALLIKVGISDSERTYDSYPHQLSGGMKQRAMIAMALVGDPELLIADEPTTALDVTIQAQVLSLLKELQQQTGMAILLITHDLGVVVQVADRVAVMYAGQIVEQADCQLFFQQPRHPYSQMLFESLPSLKKKGSPLAVISGLVPELDQVFSGCRFVNRCPHALPICHDQIPLWQDSAMVRCHRHAEEIESIPVKDTEVTVGTGFSAQPALLKVVDLKVHFPLRKGLFNRVKDYVRAVDGVSFNIAAGQTLALVGESGCGKTTVGKAILQLYQATAGSVFYAGHDLQQGDGRSHLTELQMVFQDPFASLNPRMNVMECIEEGMLVQGIERDVNARRRRVSQLLEQVGLAPDCGQRYPHEFSGGQRQRISIARAIAVNPRLLICDEPTSALDVSVQAQILNLFKTLQQDLGLSYLFISHDLSVVSYLADYIAVMYQGRIVEQGLSGDILQHPQHPYTQTLLQAAP
ncbi:MAG: ABC transporter ATP-binding protein [Gammaproteobacteria bacterium]|nr:ABC transporter ATP-binding protein [Gammaproteobacteria bacterium]